jgi:hypothetical protein
VVPQRLPVRPIVRVTRMRKKHPPCPPNFAEESTSASTPALRAGLAIPKIGAVKTLLQ